MGLIVGYLIIGMGAVVNFHQRKGLCLTAKKNNCDKEDRPVYVKTPNNLIYYCNECKACQIHDVRMP